MNVMTLIIEEQMSALLDGELPAEQEELLLRRLGSEPLLRQKMARFGLIGELLRDPTMLTAAAQISALSISGDVSAAVEAEATPGRQAADSFSPASVGMGFFGSGIAASIALLVIFNLAGSGNAERTKPSIPIAQSTQLVHDDTTVMAIDAARLTRYLVSHAQYTNSASRQLFNSHVAMAAHVPADWASHE